MKLNRRAFVGSSLAGVAGAAAGQLYRGATVNEAAAHPIDQATWHKAPCRFCGTGCGVEVAVAGERVVGVRGDELSPVNEGLLCAKGYGLPFALYGADRLTQPLIRNAQGVLEPATWDEALDLIAQNWSDLINAHGPDAVAIFGSGQWTIPEGYAALKLLKGGIREVV